MSQTVQVVIVGAGLSGLICALYLEKHGIDVLVLEKEEQVGGRVATDVLEGFTLDRGFQVLQMGYPAAQRWLDYEELDLRAFPAGSIIYRQGAWNEFADPIRNPTKLLQTLLSPIASVEDKLRVGWLRAELYLRSTLGLPAMRVKPNVTTLEFLRNRGFSENILETFFRPFFSGVFLETGLLTRAEKFLQLFSHFSTSLAAVPATGMSAIPNQLASRLRTPPQTNTHVEKIEKNSVHTSKGQISAQRIVLAGFEPERLLQNQTLPFHSCRTFYFSGARFGTLGSALRLVAEPGPICNIAPLGEIAPYSPQSQTLIAATSLCESSTTQEVTTQLERLLPHDWTHLREYRIPCALPQERASLRQHTRISEFVSGCGDHRLSGSIQGAMASGELAAREILSEI